MYCILIHKIVQKYIIVNEKYVIQTLNHFHIFISDNILSEGETALALAYLMGDSCLYQAACEVPHTAKEYLGAAEIVFQTINLLPQYVAFIYSYHHTITIIKIKYA